jgi:hypothetical protein
MSIDPLRQLQDWADTVSIVSTVTGPIEPGQRVDLEILSSARELSVTDSVANVQLPVGTGTLLPSLPVRLKVAWRVTTKVKTPHGEKEKTLTPGTDYLITKAAQSANSGQGQLISMIFMPPIVELGVLSPEAPMPVRITVEAVVTLEVLHSAAELGVPPTHVSFTIPNFATRRLDENHMKLPLELVPLEIPTFLALFRHADYRPFERDMEPGFALMIVPGSSPLRGLVEVANDVFQRLEDAVRPLRALAGMATLLTPHDDRSPGARGTAYGEDRRRQYRGPDRHSYADRDVLRRKYFQPRHAGERPCQLRDFHGPAQPDDRLLQRSGF